jgi:exopolyphosphatase / guanosine-5'-triphosphate,3'-diphosphate pyrophosphatase
VVDLGTNSTRLLVADVADGRVSELDRRTTVTRLGEGVDSAGRLSTAAIGRVLDALAGYRRAMDDLGAGEVVAIATSAARDAANAGDLRDAIADRYGIDVRTISGGEEAALTFLGATSARRDSRAETLVVDIGGGSTELVVGTPGAEPRFHVSTDLGVVRQTERHIEGDPPGPEQVDAIARDARGAIEEAVAEDLRTGVATAIAVAGTPTSLAAIEQRLDPYDRERVQGYRLSREAVDRMLAALAAVPLEERRRVPGLHPDRAPTIVAGTAILRECMGAFDLREVGVSEADLLHGAALQAGGFGPVAGGELG